MIATLPYTPVYEEPQFVAQVQQGSSTIYAGVSTTSFDCSVNGIPISVFYDNEEGGWRAENEQLATFGSGASLDEAVTDFLESALNAWNVLKDIPESQMTLDASEVRSRLARYFGADQQLA